MELYINLEKSSCDDFMNKITEKEQTLGTMKEIVRQTFPTYVCCLKML